MRSQPLYPPRARSPRTPSELFDDYEESTPSTRTGAPFTCESHGQLSLHFDLNGVQSQMDLADPTRLQLGYTRTIMRFLEFQPQPRHIGMVGLGGGSLVKYCLWHLPTVRMTVAEISPEVIALRRDFLIPPDGPRFQVVCEDGATFVPGQESAFDVLILDAFDSGGQPSELCSEDFYFACRRALTPGGVLVVNICDGARSMLIPRLRRAFAGEVHVMNGEDTTNTIAFAFSQGP